MPTYVCSDKKPIYNEACDLIEIPHYEKPSQYNKVLETEGFVYEDDTKSPEEIGIINGCWESYTSKV